MTLSCEQNIPTDVGEEWATILPRIKLGPHRKHFFHLENVNGNSFTHVRVTIYPDGGIKRVRIMGRRIDGVPGTPTSTSEKISSDTVSGIKVSQSPSSYTGGRGLARLLIPALPLTTEAFAPFGQVLMAWADPHAAPRGIKVTSANQGTAHKFHNLSFVESSYPAMKEARPGFSVYRSTPAGAKLGGKWEVKLLERHRCTNQAFIPMGSAGGVREDELADAARAYLVVVALNGDDDGPDLSTLRGFVATTSQGIVYNTGVWRECSNRR